MLFLCVAVTIHCQSFSYKKVGRYILLDRHLVLIWESFSFCCCLQMFHVWHKSKCGNFDCIYFYMFETKNFLFCQLKHETVLIFVFQETYFAKLNEDWNVTLVGVGGLFRLTTWWGLNLIEKKSSRIAESEFGYLRVCNLIIFLSIKSESVAPLRKITKPTFRRWFWS